MIQKSYDKINLLLIEDDPAQTFLIQESLNSDQYEITIIQDGKEALDFLLSTRFIPDLVLLDYHLPNVNGLTIMNTLKEKGKMFDIIFLTADYSIDTAIKSISSGAIEFIPKDGRFVSNIPAVIEKAYQNIKARKEREAFEQALKSSEQRFKTVLEASKDGIFEWNARTGESYVSATNAYMMGYTPEEFPTDHQGFFSLIHPDDREMLMQRFYQHLQSNAPIYEVEIRVRCKDGNFKWILERGIVVEKSAKGMPVRVIGTHSDISERKITEERIIEANRRLTTLIDNLSGIVYRASITDHLATEYISERITHITGYTPEEFMERRIKLFDIIHPSDKDEVFEEIQRCIEFQSDYDLTYRIITRYNTILWVWDHGKIVKGKNNEVVALEGYIADITEKRASEEALRQSEEEKKIILDNSLQSFILINTRSEIISFNKVANHRTIMSVGKTLKKGKSLFDFFPEEEKTRIENYFNKVSNGEPTFWEQPFELRGQLLWYENVMVPVFISRDEIKFICFTSSDITERKSAEEKLLYSENLYNTTINAINDPIYVVDNDLNILLVNNAMMAFIPEVTNASTIQGKNLFAVFKFLKPELDSQYLKVIQTGETIVTEETYSLDNKTLYTEKKISPVFQQNSVIRVVTILRDITERKNFEKRIMNAIIETEEKERKRFSEDLHDELGSLLSTIKIYINTIHKEDVEAKKKDELVNFTNELIDQAIQNTKIIANNLSPNVIKKFGLVSAISSFCEKINVSTGIDITFNADDYTHQLTEDEEISIYRITSELINNTVKHANASSIKIRIKSIDSLLVITYADNGNGFDFDDTLLNNMKGLGLQNIVTRINSLNGAFNILKQPKGFAIDIELFRY